MRMTPVVLVLLMAVAAAGCTAGGAPAGGAAGSGRAAGPAAAAAPPGTVGIGASEARARGVLSAPYDAALRGPSRAAAGRATLRLLNRGTRADSYRIKVLPAGAATLTPATARLAPGGAVAVDVRLAADASVRVFSVGRGAEVADLPLSWG